MECLAHQFTAWLISLSYDHVIVSQDNDKSLIASPEIHRELNPDCFPVRGTDNEQPVDFVFVIDCWSNDGSVDVRRGSIRIRQVID
ncbi:hypothetical protein KIN20_035098 [Parelaphostrongylus tenuis]|uniref:Uncharacterized protein n=1 Tax=Parelaphostrongylus tenuis TaxID=148309 RepID=A0AAD5RAY8_PARTN|nr:hypothetical protein KIN20_035098 [Parelaphostrongylus tenuis]